MKSTRSLVQIISAISILGTALPAVAATAPDATNFGTLTTSNADYQFSAIVDPDIIGDRATEIWANVYRPDPLPAGTSPVLVLLHGNHATCGTGSNPRVDTNCQYTTSGTCPSGFVMAPSYLGYAYIAERLASWGYVVVSINANRGITCGAGVIGDSGLNLARGRLILKHIQRLSEWNNGISPTPGSLGVDLTGKLDFSQVGLFGHSRGGEGVRAAYNLYRDAGSPWPGRILDPVTFRAIFEVGAVDGQTSRVLNADGTVWNQLLPMCDGDVSNLQGVKPFDRMMRIFTENPATQKSTFTVWGANHNYYNTEWQISDASGCQGPGNPPLFSMPVGSPAQRQTSLASTMALLRGNVGTAADPTFNQNFNPMFDLPPVVTDVTRVDRSYTDSPASGLYPGSPTTVFEDFSNGTGTSEYGFTIDTGGLLTYSHGTVPNHDPSQKAALISWNDVSYLQTNWTDYGTGNDISAYQTLDIRLSRQSSALNPVGPTSFSIYLVMANGSASAPVSLGWYTDLRGPVGGAAGGLHPILQTARIPLTDFAGADLTRVQAVLFYFDDTSSGAIYLGNTRLSRIGAGTGAISNLIQANGTSSNDGPTPDFTSPVYSEGNMVVSTRQDNGRVIVQVQSAVEIPVTNSLLAMEIGNQESVLSEFVNGDTHNVAFTFDAGAFAQTNNGDPITVRYGASSPVWNFGNSDKRLIIR